MSSDLAIKVDHLSKSYQIYDRPRDRLLQMLFRGHRQYYREFWALRDISFEVKKGETVGIVGRNGSGKSTLLQLICGTLNPSGGTIQTHGRIAALLELGSGFNPEFTGRENVYMNASVLGLSHAAIDQRFDSIAAFADIGEFIEQPVKTYSSGMFVRLAFAVIAHVDAEILIIDEALSVGDAIFTQRCMRFIRGFQERGTLLFVSHDMGSVLNLCKTGIWLEHGVMQEYGGSKEVADAYLQSTLQACYGEEATLDSLACQDVSLPANNQQKSAAETPVVDYAAEYTVQDNLQQARGWRTGLAEILAIRLEKVDSDAADEVFRGWERVRVVVKARAHQPMVKPILGFLIRDRLGQDLFGENTLPFTQDKTFSIHPGQEFEGEFVFRLPMLPNGDYAVMTSVAEGERHDNIQHHYLHDALILHVVSSQVRYGLVGVPFEDISLKTL